MTMSHITEVPEQFDFEVPDHKSSGSATGVVIAPVRLTAPIPVSETASMESSAAAMPQRMVAARVHSAFVIAGVIALAGGTGTLVVAALAVR